MKKITHHLLEKRKLTHAKYVLEKNIQPFNTEKNEILTKNRKIILRE
jgi:hypothetical protein